MDIVIVVRNCGKKRILRKIKHINEIDEERVVRKALQQSKKDEKAKILIVEDEEPGVSTIFK